MLEVIEEDSAVYDESQDWLKLVDRGGLMHINSKMFQFMSAMELVVKAFLKKEDKPRDVKSEMLNLIEENENVKSCWRAISAEWDPKESEILFTMIIDLWVTIVWIFLCQCMDGEMEAGI